MFIGKTKAGEKMMEPPLRQVCVNGRMMKFIKDDYLTVKEIEELRDYDECKYLFHGRHAYANFLPDNERPEGIPDYQETLKRAKKE